jgi:hypothetical protein
LIDPISLLFPLLFLYLIIHSQLQFRALTNARLKLIREIKEKNISREL